MIDRRFIILLAPLAGLSFGGTILAGQPEPAPSSGSVPASSAPTVSGAVADSPSDQPTAGFKSAADLLNQLETADRDLRALSADLVYTRLFDLVGETQTWRGTLHFFDAPRSPNTPSTTAAPTPTPAAASGTEGPRPRRFAIDFISKQIGDRLEDSREIYIFDGTWLVQKYPTEQRLNKTQIVPPGETFDPLKIGEGPLPIPIGQRRRDIEDRFTVTLLAADAGFDELDLPKEEIAALRKFVAGAAQLRLVPKGAEAETSDFKEVRIWYGGEVLTAPGASAKAAGVDPRLLPRMARTRNRDGDQVVVQLLNVATNSAAQIDPAVADSSAPEGWEVTERAFRGRTGGTRAVADPPASPEKPAQPDPAAPPAPDAPPAPAADPKPAGN